MKALAVGMFITTLLFLTVTIPADAAAPTAEFVAAATSGTAPVTIQFIDASEDSPASWAWSFGDGNTSTLENPSHTYTSSGSYTVTLTVTNADGSDTVSKSAYVTVTGTVKAPVASFVAAVTSGTAPLAVQFADSSTNSPTAWVWSFGDGGTSTIQNPSHTYTSAGSYTVTLTAISSGGSNTVSQPACIAVTDTLTTPDAAFLSAVTTGSVPLTIQFADASTGTPSSWVWSFGDGSTSTEQNPSHTYTKAGSYTVTLTASNSAGSDTVSEAGYIEAADAEPVVSFTSNITTGTVPFAVQFNDTSVHSPVSWEWSFGDGGTSEDQDPVHTFTKAGRYAVTLTAANTAGSNSTTLSSYVTAASASLPVVSFTADNTRGTIPLTVHFTDMSASTPTSWLWEFGDGDLSDEKNPTHTYRSAGSFAVTLTAYNAAGSGTATVREYIVTASGKETPVVTEVPVTRLQTVAAEESAPAAATTAETREAQEAASATGSSGGGSGAAGIIIPVLAIVILAVSVFALIRWAGSRRGRREL